MREIICKSCPENSNSEPSSVHEDDCKCKQGYNKTETKTCELIPTECNDGFFNISTSPLVCKECPKITIIPKPYRGSKRLYRNRYVLKDEVVDSNKPPILQRIFDVCILDTHEQTLFLHTMCIICILRKQLVV